MKLLVHGFVFVILINHEWRGAAAILSMRQMKTAVWRVPSFLWELLERERAKIKIAEATDWITKYFIIFSFMRALSLFSSNFEIIQKAIVLISRSAHTTNQEFEKKHSRVEITIMAYIKERVLIITNSNCKFDFKENI